MKSTYHESGTLYTGYRFERTDKGWIYLDDIICDNWWFDGEKEALAHIHVGFFKGGKPEVSAGGEDASKARTAIHNRNHWR